MKTIYYKLTSVMSALGFMSQVQEMLIDMKIREVLLEHRD